MLAVADRAAVSVDFPLLIGGMLVPGDQEMVVINPATEEPVASCARASKAQLDAAVAAAKDAFPGWAATPVAERQRVLVAIADRIEANADVLARLLTQEQGKPLAAATGEVLGSAAYFRYYAGLDLPIRTLIDDERQRVEVHSRPLGVVGAIVPWNFPLILLAFKLPPALLAGNTVVVKPAATTPLSTLKLGALIADLLPPGVVNVIADANDLGGELTAHPDIAKISFTGSTPTGMKVMAGAASTLKRLTLELGGNDSGIVLGDVDPKVVAPRLFDAAFANSGQVCIALKRLYVHDDVYDEVCGLLAALADQAIVGDGLEQGVQFGPLQNRAQFEKVQALIETARSDGRIIAGGERVGDKGFFIRPTIVRDIADGTALVDEEQFGPVLPVLRFSEPDDAVRRANASPFGLGGSVWSNDPALAYELAAKLDAGTVWINKHLDLAPAIPFGGVKHSGFGTELGEAGLAEFTQTTVINIAR